MPRDWLGTMSPQIPILCQVRRKTLTQSRSQMFTNNQQLHLVAN